MTRLCLLSLTLTLLLVVAGCATGQTATTALTGGSAPVASGSSTTTALTATTPPTHSSPGTTPPVAVLELPDLSLADVAHVTLALDYQAVASGTKRADSPLTILSPAADTELVSQLLAAYAKAVPDPAKTPDGQASRWTLTLARTDGVEYQVQPQGADGGLVSIVVGARPRKPSDYRAVVVHAPELVALVDSLRAPGTVDRLTTLSETRPADFGFLLGYGVDARTVVDSFAGTFTKDLVQGVPSTALAHVALTPEELDTFYRRLVATGIADYPAVFEPKSGDPNVETMQTPYESYYLRLRVGGRDLAVTWADQHVSADPKAIALRNLFHDIAAAMEAKPEVQALPPANGGYV